MIGVIIMTHRDLHRTKQIVRHYVENNCPVVVHVDKRYPEAGFAGLRDAFLNDDLVQFCDRVRCEWGTFSLVQASLNAVKLMLETWPDVGHVNLVSGSCLPIKPIDHIRKFLADFPDTDFIESVLAQEDAWVFGGLSSERFKYYFPFSWTRHRWLFDQSVDLQRKYKVARKIPGNVRPYLGSQWWSLSAKTLRRILDDPKLVNICRYFRLTWIPDESFFQSMARKHSDKVISKSLTLARFDYKGKPFIFHDDHLDMLLNHEAMFARKIWPGADGLFTSLLSPDLATRIPENADSSSLDRLMRRAKNQRGKGRVGLYSQSGFTPGDQQNSSDPARPYFVFDGVNELVPDLQTRMQDDRGMEMHGYLFEPDRLEFKNQADYFGGNQRASLCIRDYNRSQFLGNIIWNRRHISQGFLTKLYRLDHANWHILLDESAQLLHVQDAWIIAFINASIETPKDFTQRLELRQLQQSKLSTKLSWAPWLKAEIHRFSVCNFMDGLGAVQAKFQTILPERSNFHKHFDATEITDLLQNFVTAADASPLPLDTFPEYQNLRRRILDR